MRHHVFIMGDAGVAIGKGRQFQHVGLAHGFGQILPELGRAAHVQGQPQAIAALEHIRLRHMGPAVGIHHLIGRKKMGEIIKVEVGHGFEHRGFEQAPLPRRGPLQQRGEHALRGVEAGHHVANGRADDTRVHGVDQQAQEAAGSLGHSVERRAIGIGAGGTETRDTGIDKARVDGVQPLPVHAQLLGNAGAEILDEHVRLRHQRIKRRQIISPTRIKRDRLLVAVPGLEMRAVQRALESPERIPTSRLLDLDDAGAQIGQQHAGAWPGDEGAHFQHRHPGQRQTSGLRVCVRLHCRIPAPKS